MIAVAMPTTTPDDATEPTGYTIDELASVARVPSRTIRFYQSKGALMAPEIRGRVAFYGPAHVERLKLIAQLQDRGLRIDAIGDLLASIDRGEMDLAEWLGVEQQVQAPWADDQPRTLTEEELYTLAGTRRPGLLADLVRSRLAERHRDVYLVRSPALLGIAMKLEAAGIDLETASQASALVRKHLSRLSEDVVALFMKRAGDGEIAPKDLGHVFESLRPLGTEAVRVIFGRAMERELRKLYESGQMAKLPGRARRAHRERRR
ncbi:MAG: MerR family transcriptional regulator [Polyangiaceae bacterium]|jgi:DNA-binding transcriptional MerR regulator